MTTKNYTFYFDLSGQYVIDNRDNFNFENTIRNWPARKQLLQEDLICFGSKSPSQRCRGKGPTNANVPKACIGKGYTFNPDRDSYVNLGKRGGTNWSGANSDLMKKSGNQIPLFFSSPEIANSNLTGWSSQSAGQYMKKCGFRKRKQCYYNCKYSIGGKNKNYSFWRDVKGWKDCSKSNWQCDKGLCFKIAGNCRYGSNSSDRSTWVTYYEYPCATPKAYTNPPSIQNGQYTSPSGAMYYVGPENAFGYSIEMIYRQLKKNNQNSTNNNFNMDENSYVGFKLTYTVNWTNSSINGYKLLDLLWFISYFPQSSSTYKNRNFLDINKSTAADMAYDYCNIRNTGGEDTGSNGFPNPLCFASINNMKNNSVMLNTLPSILSGPPCQDYKNCPDWKSVNNKGGWVGYCSDKNTYNNQFCKNFYSAFTDENVIMQPEIISALNETCATVFEDEELTIDKTVCGCFMNKTSVYDDIKKDANLPTGFQLGKPKCFYAPCTSSLYQNAGTCPNITFSQCIQNSYPSVSAGGTATDTDIAVQQTIENCGPKPSEKKSEETKETDDNLPAPLAVDPNDAPQESSEGSLDGSSEGSLDGSSQGSLDGSSQGSLDGSSEGSLDGSSEGSLNGSSQGSLDGSSQGSLDGSSQGSSPNSDTETKKNKMKRITIIIIVILVVVACGILVYYYSSRKSQPKQGNKKLQTQGNKKLQTQGNKKLQTQGNKKLQTQGNKKLQTQGNKPKTQGN
jgi:preprotein translocase subunit SecG